MRLLLVSVLFALTACASARTTTRQQQPVSAHITSLNDKDAKRKAMEHPAFANAGKQAGVEVWRIENFDPVPVPPNDKGKFYKGDSYIVLKTNSNKRNELSWDIHYWLGSQTSQDEAGAAAILTVGLDDKFNGAPVQHRETEGHESSQFLGYFQPAIRYLDGGTASGFSHVTTNAGAEKRLFQIKGKRNVRVRQVDPLISSMNKGDCFILDVNQDIYIYVGEKAKNVEKLKAISVANQIRDQDHNGRAKIEIIDAYSNQVDTEKFFNALGSGNRQMVPEESAGGDDQAFERNEAATVTLSEISDSSGSLKITPLPKPLKQEQLKPQECYILDTVTGSIYVWVGKQATDREKTEAMAKAQQFLTLKKYPAWVHVTRIPQGTEPAAFKQYFETWRDVGMKHSRIVRSASDAEIFSLDPVISMRRSRSIAKSGAARGFMPDNGDGQFTVYSISGDATEQLYNSSSPGEARGQRFGEFYEEDNYLIVYQFNGEAGANSSAIYSWSGKNSGNLSKQQLIKAKLFGELGAGETMTTYEIWVKQGEEPKHFLKMFKGRFITHFGGSKSGRTPASVRMFRIHGTKAGEDMRAEQVPTQTKSINSDDVFLLDNEGTTYLWYGEGSSDDERAEAVEFAEQIQNREHKLYTINHVHQGQEPHDFWSVLDGSPSDVLPTEQWRQRLGKRLTEPRLFDANFYSDNRVSFEEITDFRQSELQEDDVYVLDMAEEVYVWVGGEVTERMRKGANHIAETYLRRSGRPVGSGLVIVLKQGQETDLFKSVFDEWDPKMWMKQSIYNAEREAALRLNEIDTDK